MGILSKIKSYTKTVLHNNPELVSNPIIGAMVKKYYHDVWASRGDNLELTGIVIENATVCNATCDMCGHGIMNRKKTIMSLEDFKKIIDIALKENILRLSIGQLGEPLLDRGIIEKLDYAYDNGMELNSITTNCSVMDSKMSEALLKYPWKNISFSIDALSSEIFNSIRGLDYNIVVDNTLNFLKLRKKMGRMDTRVRMQMVVYDINEHEVDGFFKKWQDHLTPGLDEIAFLYATNYAGVSRVKQYTGDLDARVLKVPCDRLWSNTIVVSINGDIPICCWDYNVSNGVGNIFKEGSLKRLWNNERMKTIRNQHLNREFDKIPICANCDVNYFIKPDFKVLPV